MAFADSFVRTPRFTTNALSLITSGSRGAPVRDHVLFEIYHEF